MQHLNLYTQLEQKAELFFSFKQQTWIVFALTVLIVIVYMVMLIGKNILKGEMNNLQEQYQAISADVETLNVEKQRQQKKGILDSELKHLQNEIAFRRKLLGSISSDSAQGENFSGHLSGLARQHIDGMWLTEIQLLEGGQQLALAGRTKKPEYVPQFLQKLAKEKSFEGHRFRVLRMNTEKQVAGILGFKLQAKDVGQEQ